MIPFRQALFDTTFDRFITKRVASVMWVLNIILTFLLAAIAFFYLLYFSGESFANSQPVLGLAFVALALVGLPLVTFLSLVLTRLAIEASVALVSVAENTQTLKGAPAENSISAPKQTADASSTQPVSKVKAPTPPLRAPEIKLNPDQARFTVEDINAMISDFEITPNDFALDVLGEADHATWIKAGMPDLKPWILLGLPNFRVWLKTLKG